MARLPTVRLLDAGSLRVFQSPSLVLREQASGSGPSMLTSQPPTSLIYTRGRGKASCEERVLRSGLLQDSSQHSAGPCRPTVSHAPPENPAGVEEPGRPHGCPLFPLGERRVYLLLYDAVKWKSFRWALCHVLQGTQTRPDIKREKQQRTWRYLRNTVDHMVIVMKITCIPSSRLYNS